jgi:hypothetical protein
VAEHDLLALAVEAAERAVSRGNDFDRRLARLDHADRLSGTNCLPVFHQPLDEDGRLAVRVFAGEDDLEQPVSL